MSRSIGAAWGVFWDLGENEVEVVSIGGHSALATVVEDSVIWNRRLSQIGDGAAAFYAVAGWDDWLIPGRICTIVKPLGTPIDDDRLVSCFIIEEVEPSTRDGVTIINVRGPGVESLLNKTSLYHPIGLHTTTNTTLSENVAGPRSETLAADAPPGVDNVILSDSDSGDVGNEIRITMSGGAGVHVTQITGRVQVDVNWHLLLEEPMPAAAVSGAAVVIRRRRVKLTSATAFTEGVEAWVTLNGGAVQKTRVSAPLNESGYVTLRDGLTAAADDGNAVAAHDWRGKATDDVTQILSYVPGNWDASSTFQTGNGTAGGSAHTPQGESAFELLTALATRAGEFFRHKIVNSIPYYGIVWRREPDSSGITLYMYDADEGAQQVTDEDNKSKGVLFSVTQKTALPLITRIYPSAGDQTISLAACSAAALSGAAALGCSVHLSTDFYEPDYVEHDGGAAAFGVRAIRETYGDISITDKATLVEIQAASDALLAAAVQTLYLANQRVYLTVDCFTHDPLAPGQTVKLSNSTRIEPNLSPATDWVILDVTERLARAEGGGHYPRTTITVSNTLGVIRSLATEFARTIVAMGQSLRRVGAAGGGSITVAGGGGGEGVTDHGLLLGLLDDDHPQYLLASGTRALSGNLAVNSGVTVDGVDISAHAADPNAHHAAVTVLDGSITLSGQAIRVADAFAGDGLSLTAGVLAAKVSTALGTKIVTDVLGVDAWANGGLYNAATGLQIKLPPHSGLVVDSSGLYLSPSTLTAATTNLVSGAGHTHAITATYDGRTTYNTLLKSGAAGELFVKRLGVSLAGTPPSNAAVFAEASADDHYTMMLSRRGTQTADLLLVSDGDAPDPLLRITAGGDLESGNPLFVSGVSGWQIAAAGDAEFNNAFIRGELHATTFVADEMHAAGGTVYLASATRLTQDATVAAVGTTFDMYVQASYDTGLGYFAANDVLRCKPMGNLSSGTLDLFDFFFAVLGVSAVTGRDMANGEPGVQHIQVRRLRPSGTTANAFVIPAGTSIAKWGVLDGAYQSFTGGMLLTADLQYAPYIDIYTVPSDRSITQWQSAVQAATPRVRVGNLRGVLGKSADEWGIAAGESLSEGNAYAQKVIVASSAGVDLRNVNLTLYDGAIAVIKLVSGSAPYLGIGGAGAPTTYDTAGDNVGFWVGSDGGTYKMRIGNPTGVALRWTGTGLAITNSAGQSVISLGGDGSAFFGRRMTIGTAGEIIQGTGTPGSEASWVNPWGTFTGLRIGNNSSVGRLVTYNAGVEQVSLNTNGQLTAGAGNVIMDEDGLVLRAYVNSEIGYIDGADLVQSLRFITSTGAVAGHIMGRYQASSDTRMIWLGSTNTRVEITDYATGDDHIGLIGTNATVGRPADPGTVTIYGDIVHAAGSGSANFNFASTNLVVESLSADYYVQAVAHVQSGTYLKAGTGVGVGANIEDTPDEGVILMDARTAHPAPSWATEVQIYAILSGSTYTLYMQKPGTNQRVALGSI